MNNITSWINHLIADIKAETPVIWKWICGVAVTISASCTTAVSYYDGLPESVKSFLPEKILPVITVVGLVAAVVASKQKVTNNNTK